MENTDWRFNRIMVGIDGSPGANRAIQWAISLARRTGAEIVAAHVGQPIISGAATFGFVGPVPIPEWQDEVRGQFQEEWCLPLRWAGLPYRTIFREGSPGPQLVDIAREEGAGLIVTGTRGLGAFREAILGSVSHYVVQHAEVPVVVVPPDRHVRLQVAKPVLTREPMPLPAAGVS